MLVARWRWEDHCDHEWIPRAPLNVTIPSLEEAEVDFEIVAGSGTEVDQVIEVGLSKIDCGKRERCRLQPKANA